MTTTDKPKRTKGKTVLELKALLIGNKFGRLTVLRNIGSIKGVQRWECVCECGKIVDRKSEAFSLFLKTKSVGIIEIR